MHAGLVSTSSAHAHDAHALRCVCVGSVKCARTTTFFTTFFTGFLAGDLAAIISSALVRATTATGRAAGCTTSAEAPARAQASTRRNRIIGGCHGYSHGATGEKGAIIGGVTESSG